MLFSSPLFIDLTGEFIYVFLLGLAILSGFRILVDNHSTDHIYHFVTPRFNEGPN